MTRWRSWIPWPYVATQYNLGRGQVIHTSMSLSLSSITWYWPIAGKVITALAGSNGSLLLSLWLRSPRADCLVPPLPYAGPRSTRIPFLLSLGDWMSVHVHSMRSIEVNVLLPQCTWVSWATGEVMDYSLHRALDGTVTDRLHGSLTILTQYSLGLHRRYS